MDLRNITIGDEELWKQLVAWGKRKNLDLVKVARADDQHLAEWAFIPRLEQPK